MEKQSDNFFTDMTNRQSNQKNNLDLDELLPKIGEFGKYQKLLIWLVCLPACIPCGFGAFNQLFMARTPDHWCRIPQLQNLTSIERKELAIPIIGNETYSQCSRYAVNWTEILEENLPIENQNWTTEKCVDGWEYNVTQVASSIVVDFNLVCDLDIYPTIGLSALNFGGPLGVYVFGILSDRIGRKISFFICLTTLIIGNALTAISTNFWFWACSRVTVGLTIPAIYQIPFIISLELVGSDCRSFVTVMTCLFYTVGLMLLSVVSYYTETWRQLAYLSSFPFIFYYIYWYFLPESPRWLLAKGRNNEALVILESIAKINNKKIPEYFKDGLKKNICKTSSMDSSSEIHQRSFGVTDLFRTPNMRLKTILITLNWFANDMVYVGLSYYGPVLGSNEHLNFFLSSVVEVPSCLLCWIAMDRFGRRWPLSLCMLLSGISCIVTVLLPQDATTATLILFLFSKFTISASFLIIYPFAGELYPTQLRGIGIGTSAYVAGIGLIIIPFITYLGREKLVLPLVIMGVVSIFGGVIGLRLPETLRHRLPQTVEEGEAFGKNWTFADCFSCPQNRVKRSSSLEETQEDEEFEITELEPLRNKRMTFIRKSSTLEAPVDTEGTIKLTHWM